MIHRPTTEEPEVTFEIWAKSPNTGEWVEAKDLPEERARARMAHLIEESERDAGIFHHGKIPRTYRLIKTTSTYEEVEAHAPVAG